MRTKDHVEVLVVGAGPVGMFCAARLAQEGIRVKVVDKESGIASRSYACALHPQTIRLLAELDLVDELLSVGVQVDRMAFYEGRQRRLELALSEFGFEFPFFLVVPQSELEARLEEKSSQLGPVEMEWDCRFASARSECDCAIATLDKLGGTGVGYSVPHWEGIVQRTTQMSADFLVAADGVKSQVRNCLEIQSDQISPPELFAFYEFTTSLNTGKELRIVLGDQAVSALWPLGDHKLRWTVQFPADPVPPDFPDKERHAFNIREEPSPNDHRHLLAKTLAAQSGFDADIQEIEWSAEAHFGHTLARDFGRDRCWLVGDAAHQTSPLGGQSMNIGFREADKLAKNIVEVLRHDRSPYFLREYGSEARAQWEELFDLGPVAQKSAGNPWLREHAARIRECLPASGEDLRLILAKLGLAASSQKGSAFSRPF